jgi:mitochondrial fission process protein 1
VSAAYGISWLYLAGYVLQYLSHRTDVHDTENRDVGYEAYKAHRKGPTPIEAANFSETTRLGMLVVKRAAFQSIASMLVPFFFFSLWSS